MIMWMFQVVCALACGAPIVTPLYFTNLLEARKNKMTAPKCMDYLPELVEASINKTDVDLNVDPKRKSLFNGKRFVFITEVLKEKLQLPVTLAGKFYFA